MTAETEMLLKLLDEKSTVRVIAGNYRALDGLRAVVDFDGGRVPAHFATPWRPGVNDPVWVMVVDGVAWIIGPTAPTASDGTVVSVASGLATLNTDIGQVVATYNQGTTLTAGQQVKLLAHGGYHVVGVKSTSPPPPDPDPGGGGGGGAEVTQTFTAIDSGSFGDHGWWTRRVYASPSNDGLYFYGTKIRDTIPGNAVILGIDIFLTAIQLQFAAPLFTTHGFATKPAGAPGLTGGVSVPVTGSGWWPLPVGFGDALKAGGSALGVGTNNGGGGGYNIFDAAPGESGQLRIRYRV